MRIDRPVEFARGYIVYDNVRVNISALTQAALRMNAMRKPHPRCGERSFVMLGENKCDTFCGGARTKQLTAHGGCSAAL